MESNETVSSRRRAIFERTLARYQGKGISLSDLAHHDLIERWTSGELSREKLRRFEIRSGLNEGRSETMHPATPTKIIFSLIDMSYLRKSNA